MAKEKTDPKTIDELKAEHGRITYLEIPGHGRLVFRGPKGEEWARYVDALSGKGSNIQAAKTLVASCRLEPDAEGMAAALRDYPGAIMPIAGSIGELGGDEFELDIVKP